MGIHRVLLLMAHSMFLLPTVHAQFVTLEGKDFKLGGEDFYPIVLNFRMEYIHAQGTLAPLDPAEVFYSIDASAGPSIDHECANLVDCRVQLLQALEKVVDMGFNTIRLVGGVVAAYTHAIELGPEERRYQVESIERLNTGNRSRLTLEGPAYTDPVSMRHFELQRDILDAAHEVGLKVILLAGEKSWGNQDLGASYMYPAYDHEAVDDYADFLARLAEELEGHPALLAYDLWNEPHYMFMESQGSDGLPPHDEPYWLKEDVCAFTTQWYDAIKANDPDHLITLGGLGLRDLEAWDPAALKLDFYSLHTYPDPGYMNEQGPMDLQAMLERHRGVLHWFGQVCHMPWIIGETGFSANQSPPLAWPRMHGSEAQQAAFTQASLEYTRAAGGSGWSWWAFQDFRWYDPLLAHPVEVRENYFGMLRLGDQNAPWYEKPAVDVVRNYVPAPMPAQPGSEPANYHNPNNLPTVPWLSGNVIDQHGLPLKEVNARIWCKSAVDLDNNPDPWAQTRHTFHSAYTDMSGNFIFLTEPQTSGYEPPVYENLLVIGLGTDRVFYGTWFNTPIPNGATHELHLHPFLFNGQLANKDIYNTTLEPTQQYHAWTDLTVQDVNVHAGPEPGASYVEMAARRSVHVMGEFHAQTGSTLHIRTLETFPECGVEAFRSMLVEVPATVHLALAEAPMEAPRLELRFIPAEATHGVRVFPNPFRDAVEVHADGNDAPMQMEVLDGLGRVVHRHQAGGSRTVLALPHLAPGPYRILVRQGQRSWTHSLIKQP